MAKAAWLTLSPMSGQGNATVQNTATVHTGRVQRTTTVTGVATGVSPNKTYSVIQKPKPEFVSFDNGTEITVGKDGGSLTIKGKSNSDKLAFSLVDNAEGAVNDLSLNLPESYTAAGASTTNNVDIAGDPGAAAEYEFSITFTGIAENLTINELQCALAVTAGDGAATAQITIKQTAGDPTFSFDNESITIEASGEAVSQGIKSNTAWTLS